MSRSAQSIAAVFGVQVAPSRDTEALKVTLKLKRTLYEGLKIDIEVWDSGSLQIIFYTNIYIEPVNWKLSFQLRDTTISTLRYSGHFRVRYSRICRHLFDNLIKRLLCLHSLHFYVTLSLSLSTFTGFQSSALIHNLLVVTQLHPSEMTTLTPAGKQALDGLVVCAQWVLTV